MKSVTKVYSLNINKGIVSAQFLGNLVGKISFKIKSEQRL